MRWRELFDKAVQEKGPSAVGRDLGYNKSTISQVYNGTYAGGTDKVAAQVLAVYGKGGNVEVNIPEGYKQNAIGHLVPMEAIKEEDLARDEFVLETIKRAKEISGVVGDFKEALNGDMQAFLDLAADKYRVKLGGARGNVTLTSFDGKYQILRAVSDQLNFDEKLQAAKALIDECLQEWTKDSRMEIRALIDSAFHPDKKNKINAKRILSLRNLNIKDEKWQRAMEAISDSVTVTGSRVYFRLYERDEKGNYNQIPLDFSGV